MAMCRVGRQACPGRANSRHKVQDAEKRVGCFTDGVFPDADMPRRVKEQSAWDPTDPL